jgi:L-lactate utilization protein LutB
MEVFLQLLPRSSTGERLNPYTSVWTGVADDGPREFHLVLLDNGRARTLADEVGRQALRCIRCSACLNVCPVYARTGGHAYGSVYPGPIGAILTPQLVGIEGEAASAPGSRDAGTEGGSDGLGSAGNAASLPYASSLCGACAEVCPVGIEIPRLLTHLRAREVAARSRLDPEKLTMRALFHTFSSRRRYERAQKLARAAARPFGPTISRAPGPLSGWTASRDLPTPARESFRDWWRREGRSSPGRSADTTRLSFGMHDMPNRNAVPEEGVSLVQDARSDILHRIRAALAGAEPSDVPRGYRTEDARERDEIVTMFAERVAEYRATVHRASADEVPATVGRIAAEVVAERAAGAAEPAAEAPESPEAAEAAGAEPAAAGAAGAAGAEPAAAEPAVPRIGIPTDLPRAWRPGEGVELVVDDGLSVQELDRLDGVLTGCAVAVAEAGAFVLDAGEGQGRRALTLLPDLHVCVVKEDQVVGLLPEAVARLEESVKAGWPLTFVAGPSATSDIELDRVEGVHGPRVLHVVLVAE